MNQTGPKPISLCNIVYKAAGSSWLLDWPVSRVCSYPNLVPPTMSAICKKYRQRSLVWSAIRTETELGGPAGATAPLCGPKFWDPPSGSHGLAQQQVKEKGCIPIRVRWDSRLAASRSSVWPSVRLYLADSSLPLPPSPDQITCVDRLIALCQSLVPHQSSESSRAVDRRGAGCRQQRSSRSSVHHDVWGHSGQGFKEQVCIRNCTNQIVQAAAK
jgi:hypothetical protein